MLRETVLILAACVTACHGSISCMDKSGKPVDWFIVYKLPKDSKSKDPLIQNGLAHMYLDVNSQSFTQSPISLDASNQAVAYTLKHIYSNRKSQNVMYMMYNDQPPDSKLVARNIRHTKGLQRKLRYQAHGGKEDLESKGHTKGDVACDHDTGYWLIHSVPKFPDVAAAGKYSWPTNAQTNGQSMLCITMTTSQIAKNVGHQLKYNFPAVYDFNIPSTFKSQFSDFVAVSKGQHVTSAPWSSIVDISSLAGHKFKSFAKFNDLNADLYSYLVAPELRDDLYVESWRNGRGTKIPSDCSSNYFVENVQSLAFNGVLAFKETKDHSKWAITHNKKWTCIGDINRMESQFTRGGGTVCLELSTVWTAFNGTIRDVERCKP